MASPTIQVHVYISWDGTGLFDGLYDDVTNRVLADPGISLEEGRDAAQTLAPPKVSGGVIELDNNDGRFSQHRAGSPIYQRVLPGRPVGYRVTQGTPDIYDGATPYDEPDPYDSVGGWLLGTQLVDEIAQTVEWGNRRVRLTTLGQELVLTETLVTVPMQTAITTDAAAWMVLDACGWPTDRRAFSVGDTTLAFWWCDERRAWDALMDLLGAEGPGTFYVDRDGMFHWENRNYRAVTARSTVSQATFSDTSHGGLWFQSLTYDPHYEPIYNAARYATRRRAEGAVAVLWTYGDQLDLAPSQELTLIARPSDPFVLAIPPVAATDYTVLAGSVTVTLTQTSGFVATIELVAGGLGATLDGLQLRGTPLTVVSETTVQNRVDASASIARFSPLPGADIATPLTVAGWPEIDPIMAEAVCDSWVNRYMEPRDLVTLSIVNADAAHLEQILTRKVSDRITIVETQTGLNHDAWINALEVRISAVGGSRVELVLACELCDVVFGVLWDAAIWNDPSAVWGI